MSKLKFNLLVSTFILCGLILVDYSLSTDLSLYIKGFLIVTLIMYIAYLVTKFKNKKES
ncbi:hypothetical protein [Bacillus sp. N1-1]|jgi:hypothetical protein|uniref:hypothetical protein n=1 Tax=Bacillus sp. N1-1 TaxID=2682541 RepID=UPI0013180507|nr:hypothetical protein [Bacillus sp. N1-1]QHA91570.1 hypothetical protein GNK04_09100 [Bacillus sp. N1-1]